MYLSEVRPAFKSGRYLFHKDYLLEKKWVKTSYLYLTLRMTIDREDPSVWISGTETSSRPFLIFRYTLTFSYKTFLDSLWIAIRGDGSWRVNRRSRRTVEKPRTSKTVEVSLTLTTYWTDYVSKHKSLDIGKDKISLSIGSGHSRTLLVRGPQSQLSRVIMLFRFA